MDSVRGHRSPVHSCLVNGSLVESFESTGVFVPEQSPCVFGQEEVISRDDAIKTKRVNSVSCMTNASLFADCTALI